METLSANDLWRLVLKQILHSGQWKLIFWLVEIILFQYLKYTFHWKRLFYHVGVYPLLKAVATNFLFTENGILSLRFFFEIIIAIRRRPIFFLKQILFLLEETFFKFFFQILTRMEVAFSSSEIKFFKESFILASGNGIFSNYKVCAFTQSFFHLVDTMLEIRCKPIFLNFF